MPGSFRVSCVLRNSCTRPGSLFPARPTIGQKGAHREGSAMAGVDGPDLQRSQLVDTGFAGGGVIHDRVRGRLPGILQQVAAEQVTRGSQDADRALRMPWDRQHLGVDTVVREPVSFFQVEVRLKPVAPGNLKSVGARSRRSGLREDRFQNMSPCSAMPASSRCMAILAPKISRRRRRCPYGRNRHGSGR